MAGLSTGELIPEFSLPDMKGAVVHVSDFRGRRSLVVVFAGAGDSRCFDLFRDLTANFGEIEYNEAKALLILTQRPADTGIVRQIEAAHFPILLDEGGNVHRRFGAATQSGSDAAAVYITDRYGEIYAAYRASDGSALPDADSVLKSLAHLLAECPE